MLSLYHVAAVAALVVPAFAVFQDSLGSGMCAVKNKWPIEGWYPRDGTTDPPLPGLTKNGVTVEECEAECDWQYMCYGYSYGNGDQCRLHADFTWIELNGGQMMNRDKTDTLRNEGWTLYFYDAVDATFGDMTLTSQHFFYPPAMWNGDGHPSYFCKWKEMTVADTTGFDLTYEKVTDTACETASGQHIPGFSSHIGSALNPEECKEECNKHEGCVGVRVVQPDLSYDHCTMFGWAYGIHKMYVTNFAIRGPAWVSPDPDDWVAGTHPAYACWKKVVTPVVDSWAFGVSGTTVYKCQNDVCYANEVSNRGNWVLTTKPSSVSLSGAPPTGQDGIWDVTESGMTFTFTGASGSFYWPFDCTC